MSSKLSLLSLLIATAAAGPLHLAHNHPKRAVPTASAGVYGPAATGSAGSTAAPEQGSYQCFSGSPASFPTPAQWLTYASLWEVNGAGIVQANGGDSSVAATINATIFEVAQEQQVDPRWLLVDAVQESSGSATAKCSNGASECGLWQASAAGVNTSPQSIKTQAENAVTGGANCGFKQWLAADQGCGQNPAPGNYFMAAYLYNTGNPPAGCSGPSNCNLNAGGATQGYPNDLANRLLGWNGEGKKTCS